jgi:hypothetical protein
MLRRCVQQPGAERRAEPFVTTGRVVIAAERVERDIFLHERMRPIDASSNAALASGSADLLHGQRDCGRRGDVTDDDHACARRDGSKNAIDGVLGRGEGKRQRDGFAFGADETARPIPDSFDRTVFMIRQQHFVAGRERK